MFLKIYLYEHSIVLSIATIIMKIINWDLNILVSFSNTASNNIKYFGDEEYNVNIIKAIKIK